MRQLLFLLLGGCASSPSPEAPGGPTGGGADDTAPDADTDLAADDTGSTTDDTAPADDTSTSYDPCTGPDDPMRDMGFRHLLGRLQSQHCLSVADQDATIAFIDTFFATKNVWCDAVYRVSSPDGLSFDGVPELVREHASVSDVVVTPAGTHVLVYNDLRPGLFAETLRKDPERFWRQGLVGVGGVGMARDRGEGFEEAPLDLHLPILALVVDPDLSLRPEGDYRLVTFHVPFLELDGAEWDPLSTGAPHDYFRAVSPVFSSFPAPAHVLASETGLRGGADPTVLDVADGEILFLGDFSRTLTGWSAPKGQYPPLGTYPDVDAALPAAAPNAVVDPDGPYRLYYFDYRSSVVSLALSDDGYDWTPVGAATELVNIHSPSVVRGVAGTWWMYFNQREPGCMEKAGMGMAQGVGESDGALSP